MWFAEAERGRKQGYWTSGRAPIYVLGLEAWGAGRQVGGFTRVFGKGEMREELAILRALLWLRS